MTSRSVKSSLVQKHFDALSKEYDVIKKNNSFYYQSVQKMVAEVIPQGKRVLDIGTGTGEILHSLLPSYGAGIDLSPGMIGIAEKKFPQYKFYSGSFDEITLSEAFDYVLLADVIEHLENPEKVFIGLERFCRPKTQVVLTMANPAWEPILLALEKLRLKMQEGPHHRISQKKLLTLAEESGFKLISSEKKILFPMAIPGVSYLFNDLIGHIPWIKRMCLIERYSFEKK